MPKQIDLGYPSEINLMVHLFKMPILVMHNSLKQTLLIADLSGAIFKNAVLDNAIFIGSNITIDQINKAESAVGTVLANGHIYDLSNS